VINSFDVTTNFCLVDDFCKEFEPNWHKILLEGKTRTKASCKSMTLSEIMTILIWFHLSGGRCFKHFYLSILQYNKSAFPGLVSYNRFVELMPMTLIPLVGFFQCVKGEWGGIGFLDSTPLPVCHNKRIQSHKVFKDAGAKRSKSTMGWYFGFKLHITINELGEVCSMKITSGNVDDRAAVPDLTKKMFGKIFADKGYISKTLFEELFKRGLKLVTHIRDNMKQKLMPLQEKLLLKKRPLVESVNHMLKDVCHIEHTRHRSPKNFLVNLIGGLCAYALHPNKPALRLPNSQALIQAAI
jgi:IS5 family transposase